MMPYDVDMWVKQDDIGVDVSGHRTQGKALEDGMGSLFNY
jgi:hypothetical protein